MPVMKLRGGNNVFQPAEFPVHIRVNEDGVEGNHYDVGGEHGWLNAQQIDGDERQCTRGEHVYEMRPRTCQPIHRLCRMMNRMKHP